VRVGWLVWVVGAAVLVGAGFGAAYLPRTRARAQQVRVAWSNARAAVDSAAISRDATRHTVPRAEELFTRAELLVAHGGGVNAATEAAHCASRADRLWRAAAGEETGDE
jgi:hypothetical protein